MIGATNWLRPETIQVLGWTLVHFLWQGAALAILLWVVNGFCRSARTRYAAAVLTLVLMTVAPAATFLYTRETLVYPQAAIVGQTASPHTSSIQQAWDAFQTLANTPVPTPVSTLGSFASFNWLNAFVCVWFAGVLVFSLRALGGWMLLERLRREKTGPVTAALLERCLALQQRLGLNRTVRFFESHLMDSPAVVGWLRPVVLLPVTALTGLSPEQLEAVIVHELAHIKRLDCFVNLFQIAAETLLFYHPAVWWVSRCARSERENCCDDAAVRICGDAREYARALTLMETWRAAPALVLAANTGSLKSRVSRILGFRAITHNVPRGGLAAIGILCLAGALLASTNWNVTPSQETEQEFVPPQALSEPQPQALAHFAAPVPAPEAHPFKAHVAPPAPMQLAVLEQNPSPAPPDTPATPSTPAPPETKGSYIQELRSVGITDLNVDDLIALKIQGVTPEYVREMRAAGFNPSVHDLIAMKVQGVTPEYVHDMRATGFNPTVRDLIGMKVQGVTPEYVREMRAAGLNPSLHDLIGMKVMGVSPDYIRQVRSAWPNATVHDMIGLKVQGVTPSDAAEYARIGLKNLSLHELIGLKVQGVTPDYIRGMQSAGLTNLTAHDYMAAKVQGVNPEFIQKARSHGFANLSFHQLLQLKMADVF